MTRFSSWSQMQSCSYKGQLKACLRDALCFAALSQNLWNAIKNPYMYTCGDFTWSLIMIYLTFQQTFFNRYEFPILKLFPMEYCLADSNTFSPLIVLGVGKSINVASIGRIWIFWVFPKRVELRENTVVLIEFFQEKRSWKQSRAEMKEKLRKYLNLGKPFLGRYSRFKVDIG